MASEEQMIGYELLKTGMLVAFRVVKEEVLHAPADEAEFGFRLELKFAEDDDQTEDDEDDAAEDIAEWAAFGFIFVLGMLSFSEAKPRNVSLLDYEEKDEFKLADFIGGLRFARGQLQFDADYIRGRRVKTRIAVRPNGTIMLETIGRGKAALRWLEHMKGRSSFNWSVIESDRKHLTERNHRSRKAIVTQRGLKIDSKKATIDAKYASFNVCSAVPWIPSPSPWFTTPST